MADAGHTPFDDAENCDCDLPKCREKFASEWWGYHAGSDPKDDACGWNIQHCQEENCHTIYVRGKNGADCDACGLRACEGCQCDASSLDDSDVEDDWHCSECRSRWRREKASAAGSAGPALTGRQDG